MMKPFDKSILGLRTAYERSRLSSHCKTSLGMVDPPLIVFSIVLL